MKLAAIREANRRDFLRGLRHGKPAATPGASPESEPVPPTPRAGSNRREFMRRTGGTMAAVAAQGNPVLAGMRGAARTGSMISGAFANLPDEELLQMPEQEWVGKIAPARAMSIAKKFPEHGPKEAAAKLIKLISYGALKLAGVRKYTALELSEHTEDAAKALRDIADKWNLKSSDIYNCAKTQLGYLGPDGGTLSGKDFGDMIKQISNKFDIKMDMKPEQMQAAQADLEKGLQKQREQHKYNWDQRQRNARYDDDSLDRWADDGGASFESRLSRALGLIW